MNPAESRTERVTTPSLTILMGRVLAASLSTTRPRVGFSPISPQQAAGIRIDPPPSLAWATGTTPAATRAAAPPEEAPEEYCRFQGLRVAASWAGSVVALKPNSGSVLLPRHR